MNEYPQSRMTMTMKLRTGIKILVVSLISRQFTALTEKNSYTKLFNYVVWFLLLLTRRISFDMSLSLVKKTLVPICVLNHFFYKFVDHEMSEH
jgi:hypothetical protein